MLDGAVDELVLDDPALLSTDIGPVIDDGARASLQAHIDELEKSATLLTRARLESGLEMQGTYLAPCAFEISDLSVLTEEHFGPILHVIRYKGEELDDVIKAINDTGFGLTLGVHTRVEHTMRKIVSQMNVGNCYVNRSMIGAVVGVQPFGGQCLSGTGPKAGGPNYLLQFVQDLLKDIGIRIALGKRKPDFSNTETQLHTHLEQLQANRGDLRFGQLGSLQSQTPESLNQHIGE